MLELDHFNDGMQTITKEVPFKHHTTGQIVYRKEQLAAVVANSDGSATIHGLHQQCTIPAEALPLLITALMKVQHRNTTPNLE